MTANNPRETGRNISRFMIAALLLLSTLAVFRQYAPQLVEIVRSETPAATVFHEEGFYFLTVARSMAEGLGPTADGVSLTTGFQPLWAGLLSVPFVLSRIFGGTDLIYVLGLMLVTVVAATALAGLTASKLSRKPSTFLFVLTVAVFANDLRWLRLSTSALEVTVYMAALLGLILLWARSPRRSSGGLTAPDVRWAALFGVALGIAYLARIDGVFFGAAYLVFLLLKLSISRRSVMIVGISGTVSAVFLALWLSVPLIFQGSISPQSGTATSGGIYPNPGIFYNLNEAARQLLPIPLSSISNVLSEVGLGRGILLGIGSMGFLIVVGLAYRFRDDHRFGLLAPHVVASAALVVFYTGFSHTPWRFDSYFMPVAILLLLLISLVLDALRRTMSPKAFAPAALLVIAVFLSMHSYLWITRPVAQGDWITPAISWLIEKDFDTDVHMFQTGRTGYQFRGTVVNLDGKMNFDVLTAHQEGRFLEYLKENDAQIVFDSNEYLDRFLPQYDEWDDEYVNVTRQLSPPDGWFVYVRKTDSSVTLLDNGNDKSP